MLDSLRNVKTSQLRLSDEISRSEQAWLVKHLRTKRGVRDAQYFDDGMRLVVAYDADCLNRSDLLTIVRACGIRARPPGFALDND